MKSILQFDVSFEDGVYTASGREASIVTFGHTFEQLESNIREAVGLFFEGEQPADLGFVTSPLIRANYELPTIAYGGQA